MRAKNNNAVKVKVLLGRLICNFAVILGLSVFLVLAMSPSAHAQSLVWAKRAGGTAIEQGQSIAVDASGNSYVTGFFQGTATFGPGEANQTILTPLSHDIFIAKYNSAGLLQWVKRVASTAAFGNGIAVDSLANVYVTGYFANSATFAPGEGNQTTLVPAGSNDLFVAKYDTNGTFLWAKIAGGLSSDEAYGIAVDGAGNSYVSGAFSGLDVTFGQGEPNQTTLTSTVDTFEIFVAKYDTNSQFQWVKRASGLSTDKAYSIAADGVGNSYVTGQFVGSVTFAPGGPNQTVLTGAVGSINFFVAKYDTNGQLQWAKQAGGTNQNTLESHISVDGSGNSYITGTLRGTATFGAGEANQTMLTSVGSDDILIAKFNTNGALQWAKQAGGTDVDSGTGIAADSVGNSYVTGYFRGTATFGPGEANQTIFTAAGLEDIFVAKFDANGFLRWVRRAGSTSNDRGLGIGIDSLRNSYVAGRFALTATFGPGEANQTILTAANSFDIFVAKYAGGLFCPSESLQAAVNSASPGETINVTGTCVENILIRNDKVRVFLNGGGTATINGPDSSRPTVDMRGKAISIQGFTITGGSSGIEVQRGANAVIDSNVIDGTGGDGVVVNQLAFAVLTNNMIQNNEEDGVVVKEGAAARIGFNTGSESVPSGNTIQMNNRDGITVAGSSSARVVGNNINNNGRDGIEVMSGAQADISNNVISSNGRDGIEVTQNSAVQLGEDPGLFAAANSGGNNAGFGISCDFGGALDGLIGTLTGTMGATDIDSSCLNSLSP